jgi:hypothetical protein
MFFVRSLFDLAGGLVLVLCPYFSFFSYFFFLGQIGILFQMLAALNVSNRGCSVSNRGSNVSNRGRYCE